MANEPRNYTALTPAGIEEAIWGAARDYGITSRIEVNEQVTLARDLATTSLLRPGRLTPSDITTAFARYALMPVPRP